MKFKTEINTGLLRTVRAQITLGWVITLTCYSLGQASDQQVTDASRPTGGAVTSFSFSPADSEKYLSTVNLKNWDDGGELSRFVYLRTSLVFPVAGIHRAGPVSILRSEPDRALSTYKVHLADGRAMSFDQFVSQVAMVDGIVIVHQGRIVYERYPHMASSDKHLLFSMTKAFIGTLVGLLEADGLIDVKRPIETYIPELNGTAWAGTPVRDILDMASGIAAPDGDIENPKSEHYRLEASLGWLEMTPDLPDSVKAWHTFDYLKTLGRASAPGNNFVYSSANTLVLAWLIEKVTGRTVYDVLSERIWSKIGAESDAELVVNRRGIGVSHAGLTATLRDVARFGLLFTPSRKAVTTETVIPAGLIHAIEQGRADLTLPKEILQDYGSAKAGAYQWVAVTKGDAFWKTGYGGQMLYVSPGKDLVVAYAGSEESRDTDPPFSHLVQQLLEHAYHSP
jgi:CubicO group peptidase (beta-lactamase class C family)